MFLLAYALQYTIQVYRLYKHSTDEFITLYPNDPEEDWPVVTLITEDDRHYNIPVRMCQETMLWTSDCLADKLVLLMEVSHAVFETGQNPCD